MTALPIHPSVIDVNRMSAGHGDEERTNKGGVGLLFESPGNLMVTWSERVMDAFVLGVSI